MFQHSKTACLNELTPDKFKNINIKHAKIRHRQRHLNHSRQQVTDLQPDSWLLFSYKTHENSSIYELFR